MTGHCDCADCTFIVDETEEEDEDNDIRPNPYLPQVIIEGKTYLAEYGICPSCNTQVKTNLLEKHIKQCGVFTLCDICLLDFEDIKTHRQIHIGKELTQCQSCAEWGGENFDIPCFDLDVNPRALHWHLKTCANKKFSDEEIARKVADITTGIPKNSCKCFKCDQIIAKNEIKEHYQQCKVVKNNVPPPPQQQQQSSAICVINNIKL